MKKPVHSGRSPVSSRRFPWLPIIAVSLTLSLLGNIFFVYIAYERSRVISVPDGDSLQLKDGRRIRLLGIDAPEWGRCMADEARGKLVERALGRHVRLKETVTDDYGRTLAIVIVEDIPTWLGYMHFRLLPTVITRNSSVIPGISPVIPAKLVLDSDRGAGIQSSYSDPLLQRALVSAGLARNKSTASSQYNRVLRDAQETAKSNKLGIWSDACRGTSSGKEDCTIKGNTRAGKKYFYTPDCPTYDQVGVDTSFGDVWFCSEHEADSAGFTLAASCRK